VGLIHALEHLPNQATQPLSSTGRGTWLRRPSYGFNTGAANVIIESVAVRHPPARFSRPAFPISLETPQRAIAIVSASIKDELTV